MASNRDSAVALPVVDTRFKVDFSQPLGLVVDVEIVKARPRSFTTGRRDSASASRQHSQSMALVLQFAVAMLKLAMLL